MSDEVKGAARRTDLIEHQSIQAERWGKIANAIFSTAKTMYEVYRVAKLGAAAGGPPGWVAIGVSFVVEYAVGKVIDASVKYYIAKNRAGIDGIETGSPNVFVNKLEGARGQNTDKVKCHGTFVEQGSRCVSYNKKPASRLDDKTLCPAVIATASTNVVIGGEPTYYNPDSGLDTALFVLRAYNAMKLGMITPAAQGKGAMDVLKGGWEGIKGEAKSELKKQIWEERAKPWAKSEGLWPW